MKQRGRPRPVLIFSKKTLYKVKASGLCAFNIIFRWPSTCDTIKTNYKTSEYNPKKF